MPGPNTGNINPIMTPYRQNIILPLLLFIISLSAMLPAGFMPGADGGIEICAQGFTQTIPDQDEGEHNSTIETPCHFAAVHSMATSANPVILELIKPGLLADAPPSTALYHHKLAAYYGRAPPLLMPFVFI